MRRRGGGNLGVMIAPSPSVDVCTTVIILKYGCGWMSLEDEMRTKTCNLHARFAVQVACFATPRTCCSNVAATV